MKHNFGIIRGRPLICFKEEPNVVLPVTLRRIAGPDSDMPPFLREECITPLEAFRRWKIARKAWRTRKMKDQLRLPL